MSVYKFERFLRHSNDNIFDDVLAAGAEAPRAGIYRCDGCGYEIVSEAGKALPAATHHEHTPKQKIVRWKLIVADGGKPAAVNP
jgi:hypothetical protein